MSSQAARCEGRTLRAAVELVGDVLEVGRVLGQVGRAECGMRAVTVVWGLRLVRLAPSARTPQPF